MLTAPQPAEVYARRQAQAPAFGQISRAIKQREKAQRCRWQLSNRFRLLTGTGTPDTRLNDSSLRRNRFAPISMSDVGTGPHGGV